MNRNNIAQALPIVAAAFGRKFGVKVEVGGQDACTNGQVIRIPQIDGTPLSKTLAWGYLAHEAAHVRFTDFKAGQDTFAKGGLGASILNILEDVRIENALCVPYPGTKTTLDAVMAWLVQEGKTSVPKEGDAAPMVLANALLVMARHRYRRQHFLKDLATEAERVLRKSFPPSFVHRLIGMLTEVPRMGSTQDAVHLAERIVALVQEEAQEPAPMPSEASENEGEDENSNANGSQDQIVDDSQDADGSEGKSEDDGDDAGQSEGESEDDGEDAGGFEGAADADQRANGAGSDGDDGRNALQEALSASAGDLPGDTFDAVAQALSAQAYGCGHSTLMPSREDWAGNAEVGLAALAKVRSESAKLTARLQALVEAHQMVRNRTVRRGRHLSARHLHRAALNDDRIFQARDRRIAPNTAIHLLVDLSGSMHGHKDAIALAAAMALAQAMESIRGVSCAVTAFPGLDGLDKQVTGIVSHAETVRARAGAFVQSARGGTPMTGALWFAAADLLARAEVRKVIVTLTDGEPDDYHTAKEMVGKAAAAGIEMIGVGIGIGVDPLFPVCVRINDVSDLKGELFRIAERLLLK